MQSKLVNKTRNETLNDALVSAVANDIGQSQKGNVSFSQLKRTETEKLINSVDVFSNYVNVKLKIDETFITDNRIARKRRKSYAEAVRYDNTLICANTTGLPKMFCELLACEKSNSSNLRICPPDLSTNSTEVSNSSNSQISQHYANVLSSQDEELLSILQDLQQFVI